eukprot:8390102-Lingulodinium_polyedra.AAC.1
MGTANHRQHHQPIRTNRQTILTNRYSVIWGCGINSRPPPGGGTKLGRGWYRIGHHGWSIYGPGGR